MSIKYQDAEDISLRISDIAKTLDMKHIDFSRVHAFRSHGSGSRGTVARCHALSKIWQKALKTQAVYLIEVISERFDKMSKQEQDKVLIHELMHIPISFGGGFKHHDYVCDRNVGILHKEFLKRKNEKQSFQNWF